MPFLADTTHITDAYSLAPTTPVRKFFRKLGELMEAILAYSAIENAPQRTVISLEDPLKIALQNLQQLPRSVTYCVLATCDCLKTS